MNNYWTWWEGAIALALVTITYTLATDRSFGVSTAWDRVVHWRAERRLEKANAQFADDRELADALAAATADEFDGNRSLLKRVVGLQAFWILGVLIVICVIISSVIAIVRL